MKGKTTDKKTLSAEVVGREERTHRMFSRTQLKLGEKRRGGWQDDEENDDDEEEEEGMEERERESSELTVQSSSRLLLLFFFSRRERGTFSCKEREREKKDLREWFLFCPCFLPSFYRQGQDPSARIIVFAPSNSFNFFFIPFMHHLLRCRWEDDDFFTYFSRRWGHETIFVWRRKKGVSAWEGTSPRIVFLSSSRRERDSDKILQSAMSFM